MEGFLLFKIKYLRGKMKSTEIIDAITLNRALSRIAHEILENNKGAKNLVLVGIRTRGVPLANRLAKIIYEIEKIEVPVGILDITLYRDDVNKNRKLFVQRTDIDFSLDNKVVVLVDEVIFTGRTIRSALDALMDLGRPAKIQLAVLIDRGHRELPIRPDFIGKNIPTAFYETIKVFLEEIDGLDKVEIILTKSVRGKKNKI